MLTLLTIVCTVGGYAQETKTITTTIKSTPSDCIYSQDGVLSWEYIDGTSNDQGTYWGATNSPITLTGKFVSNVIIKSIVVNAKQSGTGKSISASVGGTTIGKKVSLTTSYKNYTFTGKGTETGDIVLTLTSTRKDKSFFISKIEITYEEAATPPNHYHLWCQLRQDIHIHQWHA